MVPVRLSPIPFGTYDTASNYGPSRVITGAFARTMTNDASFLLDAQAAISGYVPSATHLPVLPSSLAATDGAHLSDAGQAILGAAMTRQLGALIY